MCSENSYSESGYASMASYRPQIAACLVYQSCLPLCVSVFQLGGDVRVETCVVTELDMIAPALPPAEPSASDLDNIRGVNLTVGYVQEVPCDYGLDFSFDDGSSDDGWDDGSSDDGSSDDGSCDDGSCDDGGDDGDDDGGDDGDDGGDDGGDGGGDDGGGDDGGGVRAPDPTTRGHRAPGVTPAATAVDAPKVTLGLARATAPRR